MDGCRVSSPISLRSLALDAAALHLERFLDECVHRKNLDVKSLKLFVQGLNMHEMLPAFLHDQVARKILQVVEKIKTFYFYETMKNLKEVILSLFDLVINSKIKVLKIVSGSCVLQNHLFQNLHKCIYLEELELDFFCLLYGSGKEYRSLDYVISALKSLNNLKQITVYYYCTEELLKSIVENCPNIRILYISDIREIKDAWMSPIMQLKTLERLKLQRQMVDDDDETFAATLLENLPNLTHLIGHYNFCRGLENISEKNETLALTFFKLNISFPASKLHLIRKCCPNLQSIHFDSFMGNISLLKSLKLVTHVTFSHMHLEDNGFQSYLRSVGKNIKSLTFYNNEGFTIDKLIFVGKICPNLDHLVFTEHHHSPIGSSAIQADLFPNVRTLGYDGSAIKYIDDSCLKFLLANCRNVRKLDIKVGFAEIFVENAVKDYTMNWTNLRIRGESWLLEEAPVFPQYLFYV